MKFEDSYDEVMERLGGDIEKRILKINPKLSKNLQEAELHIKQALKVYADSYLTKMQVRDLLQNIVNNAGIL
jgi:hypothetical protein